MKSILAAVATLLVAVAAPASAHLGLDAPTSRYGQNILKTAPCGMLNGARSENVSTFEAGQTITVRWNEYVNHPGHYRIAFDDDGHDDFVEPRCLAECDNRDMDIELYSNDAVLMDGIPDANGGDYSVEITLPDVVCDNCTLQVVQVMTDKPPYTAGGNDLYYQCADLVLVPAGTLGTDMGGGEVDMGGTNNPDLGAANNASPDTGNTHPNNQTPTPDMGTPGADTGDTTMSGDEGGCATGGSGGPSGGWTLVLASVCLVGLRRRR